jgi:OOP family OmpA-OmpF porin
MLKLLKRKENNMKKKSMLKIIVPLAMVALLVGFAQPALSDTSLNDKVKSGEYVQKVDAFEVIFDATESMNALYKGKSVLSQEKALVTLFNNTIPDIKLNAAARAFGQFKAWGDAQSKVLFPPRAYSKAILPQAIAPFPAGKGFSPLDAALDGAITDLKYQSGRLAVIVFSDGLDMKNYQPAAAAQRLKNAYGDRICIYTVLLGDKSAMYQLGDESEGMNVMKQVADAGKCGFMVKGYTISSPEGMASFVEKVFLARDIDQDGVADYLDKCPKTPKGVKVDATGCPIVVKAPPAPKPAPAPAPAPVPVTMTINILFAFDKADIQPQYKAELQKVADLMKSHPGVEAVIEGHTDSVGSPEYNKQLSQARATSVRDYLVKEFGIDSSRLKAVGYGQDKPIASNSTREGRKQNRRVVACFSNIPCK